MDEHTRAGCSRTGFSPQVERRSLLASDTQQGSDNTGMSHCRYPIATILSARLLLSDESAVQGSVCAGLVRVLDQLNPRPLIRIRSRVPSGRRRAARANQDSMPNNCRKTSSEYSVIHVFGRIGGQNGGFRANLTMFRCAGSRICITTNRIHVRRSGLYLA